MYLPRQKVLTLAIKLAKALLVFLPLYHDRQHSPFSASERKHTTILVLCTILLESLHDTRRLDLILRLHPIVHQRKVRMLVNKQVRNMFALAHIPSTHFAPNHSNLTAAVENRLAVLVKHRRFVGSVVATAQTLDAQGRVRALVFRELLKKESEDFWPRYFGPLLTVFSEITNEVHLFSCVRLVRMRVLVFLGSFEVILKG
jgi:hypothetical protein